MIVPTERSILIRHSVYYVNESEHVDDAPHAFYVGYFVDKLPFWLN